MFKTISYLQKGNAVQARAYGAISALNVMNDFAGYSPVLCGTIPIAIDIEGSDLDIVMEVYDFASFKREVDARYGTLDRFVMKDEHARGVPAVTCNFHFEGFEFELFAQPVPIDRQYAYRHMVLEHHLLQTHPESRNEIIRLKKQGFKTEPAFAKYFVLTSSADPYEELLSFGERMGF